jgi:hypothetical protein
MSNGKIYIAKLSEDDLSELKNMLANILANMNKMKINNKDSIKELQDKDKLVIRNCKTN